jgi:hypothetical protein
MFSFDRTGLDRLKVSLQWVISTTMMHSICGLECINRCWTEWGVSQIQNGFRPLYWYKTLGRCVFQTICKLLSGNLLELFSSGFQRCICMRIRFFNFFLNFQQSSRQAPVHCSCRFKQNLFALLPHRIVFYEKKIAFASLWYNYLRSRWRNVVWNIKTEVLTTFRHRGGYYATNTQTKILFWFYNR